KTGEIGAQLFAPEAALATYAGKLATVDLSGKGGWIPIMYGTAQDPQGDSQAGAADTDIVADAVHGSLYTAFDDGGTTSTSDDSIAFRVRVDNPTSSTPTAVFNGVLVIGMDTNLDGRIDLFLTVDARSSSRVVQLMDPGTDANISPSTTSTAPLPTGWLPNNGIYPITASNFSTVAVSSSTDSNWNGNTDVGNDGKTDVFVSFRIPLADIAKVLAIPSPADRNGVYGPRGPDGLTGFTKDTQVRYVSFTQTQAGPINGGLNGGGKSYDKNATFSSLGAMTAPMSAANPISAADFATITTPVDANGLINAAEDNTLVVHGTATANGWVRLTVTDSANASTVSWVQADGGGAWTAPAQDLSSRPEGTLTFTAERVTASGSATVVAGSTNGTATAIHDTVPPVLAVDPLATNGHPLISGTSTDIPAGSTIALTIDPNGDGDLSDAVTYATLVSTGGAWSVNTAAVAPSSGTVPASGFTGAAKITASGSDLAGNTATAVALDAPTVVSQTTNRSTPTIIGTWGGSNGGTDSLAVTVNGTTYTTSGGHLATSGTSWTLTIPSALPNASPPTTYEVQATTTRSTGGTASDISTGELVLVSGPVVDITSAGGGSSATVYNGRPIISGTATSGDLIVLRIDPNNDGVYTDAITYTVVATGGAWSIDTATAVPVSGTFPGSGLSGAVGLLATVTDSQGRTATDAQTLSVVTPTVTVGKITGAYNDGSGLTNDNYLNASESNSVIVSGTSSAVGSTVTVTFADGRDATANITATAVVQSNGSWTASAANLSALQDGSLTVTANVSTASQSVSIAKDTSAYIAFTSPTLVKRSTQTFTGVTDLAAGSVITLTSSRDGQVSAGTGTQILVQAGTNGDPNTWSVVVSTPNNLTAGLATFTASSTGTDVHGNTATSASYDATAQSSPPTVPTVAITDITGAISSTSSVPTDKDSVITLTEGSSGITLKGTTNQTAVTMSISDGTTTLTPTATVAAGSWTATLTTAQIATLKNGPLNVRVTVTASGASNFAEAHPVLDWTDQNPSIAITTPVGDGNLSATESAGTVSISGTTASIAAGQTVTVTVTDGTSTRTATTTVQAGGAWTATFSTGAGNSLSGLIDGTLNVTARTSGATDAAASVLLD